MSDPRLPEVPVTDDARVLGVGADLVHVPGLAHQLTIPGSVFAERAFTARELRDAVRRADATGSLQAEHLAVRWAAKEAFIKAWSQVLALRAGSGGDGAAPVIPAGEVDWRQVEVVSDRWGRPTLNLTGNLARAVEASLGAGGSAPRCWPVSLSHDGDYGAAIVLAVGRAVPSGEGFELLGTHKVG